MTAYDAAIDALRRDLGPDGTFDIPPDEDACLARWGDALKAIKNERASNDG